MAASLIYIHFLTDFWSHLALQHSIWCPYFVEFIIKIFTISKYKIYKFTCKDSKRCAWARKITLLWRCFLLKWLQIRLGMLHVGFSQSEFHSYLSCSLIAIFHWHFIVLLFPFHISSTNVWYCLMFLCLHIMWTLIYCFCKLCKH